MSSIVVDEHSDEDLQATNREILKNVVDSRSSDKRTSRERTRADESQTLQHLKQHEKFLRDERSCDDDNEIQQVRRDHREFKSHRAISVEADRSVVHRVCRRRAVISEVVEDDQRSHDQCRSNRNIVCVTHQRRIMKDRQDQRHSEIRDESCVRSANQSASVTTHCNRFEQRTDTNTAKTRRRHVKSRQSCLSSEA